jgi:hypothetical protein
MIAVYHRSFEIASGIVVILKDNAKNRLSESDSLFFWRRHPDLNWGVRVLQTLALPLGHGAAATLIIISNKKTIVNRIWEFLLN